mmetsp:Transcript_13860/g.13816  ORF Transcript_13860/g.13816 Transcript_13860/m.13816 type:complete len:551 (+) Transcript_13860:79-1731(+)
MRIIKSIDDFGKVIFEGPLIKKKKKKEEFQKIYYYRLTDKGKMIQFKNKDSTNYKGAMDIKNCRINKGKFKNQQGEYFYGINIIGRKENQDFYSLQEIDIDQWYQNLVRFCVLLDLTQKYKRLNKIGKGNFATVYKYERISDKKIFAVKSLEKRKIMESKRGSNDNPLLNEIEVMRTCDHPNIIKLYEVHEADKHVHLVMEVLEGGELFNRIRNKGTYTEADAIKIMRNILDAMAYLHERRIVHRDLKPENLILASPDDDYDVKIADFGLASFVPEGKKLELACGSPGYVSCELLQDPPPGYDCKADIFSIGVILYILLTGRPAFPGTDYKQIFEKNKKGEPSYPKRFWDKISEPGQNLVKSMIQKDPELRLSAQECLQHEWFQVEGGSEVLGDVAEGWKEFDEQENAVQAPGDASTTGLQTTTPVMAGRKLKDTCESPWNPTGLTPKMMPATPMLKDGFDGQPKRMDVNKLFGAKVLKQEEEKKEEPKTEIDTLKKFDLMQRDRKGKNHQDTMKFPIAAFGPTPVDLRQKQSSEKSQNASGMNQAAPME